MRHGELSFQLVATLTGAGILGLFLIALITSEPKQRMPDNPDPEVHTINLWKLFKQKVYGLTNKFMAPNRTIERRANPEADGPSMGDSRDIVVSSRGLKWVEEKQPGTSKAEESHPVRHGHSRQQQLLLLQLQHRGKGKNTSENLNHQHGDQTPPHDLCYSGNQVLVVIGLTCLLNFAFVLVVVACVHYLNRVGSNCVDKHMSPGTMSRYDSMESETEGLHDSAVSLRPLCPRCPPSHSMERLLFLD